MALGASHYFVVVFLIEVVAAVLSSRGCSSIGALGASNRGR